MCEKHYCTHSPETLCSCAPVQSGDVAQIVFHMAENMEDIRWELDYKSLADLSGHRLCAVGKCRQCGGRLCAGQYPVDAQTPEDFLAAVYRQLNQFHRRLDAALSHPAFRERFAAMFHEEDRPFVEDWLETKQRGRKPTPSSTRQPTPTAAIFLPRSPSPPFSMSRSPRKDCGSWSRRKRKR